MPRPPAPPFSETVSAHQEQTRRLVGAMMKLTGRTATGLALAAGLTPSTLNRFMHRRVEHTLSQRTMLALMTQTFRAIKDMPRQSLDTGALADLAPAIPVYERGILQQAPEVELALSAAKSQPGSVSRMPADLPVLIGTTRGVSIAVADFSQAPMQTPRPPFLDGDRLAFALLMPDDSMLPRFDAGDMLYVSPARRLDGEKVDVVLELHSGGFVVGSLTNVTQETLRISRFSPRTRETYDRTKLRGAYRIVGIQRFGG